MQWIIENNRTTGVCRTNKKAREDSWQMIRSTNKREQLVAECANREIANKMYVNLRHDMRMEMSSKKHPVPVTLIMRRVRKDGTQLDVKEDSVKIRWDNEATLTQKMETIHKYASIKAKQIVKKA